MSIYIYNQEEAWFPTPLISGRLPVGSHVVTDRVRGSVSQGKTTGNSINAARDKILTLSLTK